ncbi:MAG TPA: ribulokinase [Actinospica sp.]|jgi:L-ribulokinase|nr:ribulokinase [Actinospica sp.]
MSTAAKIVNAHTSADTAAADTPAAGAPAADACVIGVDYGTLSGRALVVRVADGAELGSAVHEYRHGVIERTLPATGAALPPDWALQDPDDYREVLRRAVPAALAAAGVAADRVIGIGVDFTACTILPTLADGTPLCELTEYRDRPHAYVKLWKHHSAQPQADRINTLAHARDEPWIGRYGGRVSSEWEYAKGLQLLEEDPELYHSAERWIEAADWITWQLTGVETRNACTAGYKGLLQDGARPSADYLKALNPEFGGFTAKLEHPVSPLGARAGGLTKEAAVLTGLPEGAAVCVGNVDAHVTAPAAKAVGPGRMVAIMGTSTCHVVNGAGGGAPADVAGMCGVVDGGIVAGLWGYEAGQSGVGDIFAWFVNGFASPELHAEAAARDLSLHELLTEQAAARPPGAHGLVALDWHSGNRSVLVDHHLSGMVLGLTLATEPHEVYRALLESTAFGTRVIVEALEAGGVEITEYVAAGGLTRNSFLMQLYADVLGRPVSLAGSAQAPALGAAIHAAVAAAAYPDVPAAAEAMGSLVSEAFLPDQDRAAVYDSLFAEYLTLHDHFGRGGNDVLHRLREIKAGTRR